MQKLEQTITTLDIAEMMEVSHNDILRKIDGRQDRKGYAQILSESQMALSDYFQESTYKDGSGKENKCYNVTKLGCDFLANKFTGEKGILFTARYVKRFHDMEDIIREQLPPVQELSPQLQLLINMELKQKEQDVKLDALDSKIDSLKEVVALNPNDWRKDSAGIIGKMALHIGGYDHIKQIREEIYKLLEQRMGVALNIRLTNKKKTMSLNGVCKSKINKLNSLDVIADDKKLIEGYIAIVKETAIKYGIADSEVA